MHRAERAGLALSAYVRQRLLEGGRVMSLRVTLTFDEPERYERPVQGTLGGVYTEQYRCGFCSVTSADDLELAEHVVRAHMDRAEIETAVYTAAKS